MDKEEFLKSTVFMNLGQNINHSSWQSAMMTLNRMKKASEEAGVHDFDRQMASLRQCILNRNKKDALDCMASVVSRRVSLINELKKNG